MVAGGGGVNHKSWESYEVSYQANIACRWCFFPSTKFDGSTVCERISKSCARSVRYMDSPAVSVGPSHGGFLGVTMVTFPWHPRPVGDDMAWRMTRERAGAPSQARNFALNKNGAAVPVNI